LTGKLRPGEKLVQLQLAKKFDVSQNMIREALFELKEYGLVETSDNRGMFVRSLDARGIQEMLVIREIFEGVAARECCGRMSTKDASKLRKLADDILDVTLAGKHEAKIALDREFHLEIVRLTDSRILMMWAQRYHFLGKVVGNARTIGPEETWRGHNAIIDAIMAEDRNQAEEAAREHVRAAWPNLEESLVSGTCAIVWLTQNQCSDEHGREGSAGKRRHK